jgi:hypothetical protein
MKISLKDLIAKAPNSSSGIFSFDKDPALIISGIDGKGVSQYSDLEEVSLSEKEKDFVKNKWEKIQKENPKYYDGNIISIVDVLYDEEKNQLDFIMKKAKYSTKLALLDPDYPNKERAQEFLSFGIGVMGNLMVGSENQFLMVERSQKVHSEKGAISVPGGEIECNEKTQKDDVRSGFKEAVKGELVEEVLSEAHKQSEFNTKLISIAYEKRDKTQVGLDAFFEILPQNQTHQITRESLAETHKISLDKFESSGNFFFVNPGENIDSKSEDSPAHIINSGKLQHSGTSALTSQIYAKMKEFYAEGKFIGLPPHPDGIANKFTNLSTSFSIFDMAFLCKSTIEKPLKTQDEAPKTAVNIEKNIAQNQSLKTSRFARIDL